ncbi:MAG: glutamine synthetase family protein [Bryobacteraceae bacterium]
MLPLNRQELEARVSSGEIETVIVAFPDLYGRLLGKRLDARFFLEKAGAGTHACNYLLTADMGMEPVQCYRFANWETGYGDFELAPDWRTLRLAAWLDKTAIVIADVMAEGSHQPIALAPRSILRQQVERAARMGYQVMMGSELEYYIFAVSYREAAAADYSGVEQAGWYLEDYHILQGTREEELHAAVRRWLNHSGVPVESTKGEWGRGQHELNLRYSDALEMADRHVLFKQCLKESADRMGLSVTFMAKYDAAQAGSSCHVHASLWQQGRNVFPGDRCYGPLHASEVFGRFLAGWIAHAPEFMVFYAPTVNSYKRYKVGSWAPTRLGWSYDNRTAAFRVVGRGESLRIECRIPGADCNPYLCFAAAIASGLDGIEQGMEPPPVFSCDSYRAEHLTPLPGSLGEAVERFESSPLVRRVLGDEVVEHYAHFYRVEQAAFEAAVTDWERRRYFEQI